jgi:hypothetical protein
MKTIRPMVKKYHLCTIFICTLILFSCTAPTKTPKSQEKGNEEMVFGYLNPNTFQLYEIAKDVKYGYTSEFPIQVGGRVKGEQVLNERRYLNALTGPKGEQVIYKQLDSCCYLKKNLRGENQLTYLDKFEISYEGNPQRFIVFIDTFDRGETLLAPKGFSFKTKAKE